jgi:signal transduction histidine kinase
MSLAACRQRESKEREGAFLVARVTTDEHPLLLATLPPSGKQQRLAYAVVAAFVVAFAITVPFAHTPLPRVDAWIPIFMAALVINDFITAALLFSQFSISQQRALQVLAIGYLFSGLMVIPYALTFPGIFAPTGLLGADLQSAVWLYNVWHIASPLSVIVYELSKGASNRISVSEKSVRIDIGLSVAIVIAVVCTLTWFVTTQHDHLPQLYLDSTHLSPLAQFTGRTIFLTCAISLALLWFRRDSVLDLWLMVTVCAWLLEITLQGLFLTSRFSIAWYMGRIFSLIASSVVLIVLLSEMTTLYAHLARSAMRQRSARQARQVAMDAMAASIAHEINQPLAAIATNGHAALRWLTRAAPDLDEACAALKRIVNDSHRANEVISGIRSMYKKDMHGRAWLGVNDLLRDVLTTVDVELRIHRGSVSTELREGLPQLFADRGQMQQVFQNLITNAIEAMRAVPDRACLLCIKSDIIQDPPQVVVTIEDSGTGIDEKDKNLIFEPFFTTKSAGTGIGLTICRSIIESHGGSLRAAANHPYGTIFEVVLPIDAEAAVDKGTDPRG